VSDRLACLSDRWRDRVGSAVDFLAASGFGGRRKGGKIDHVLVQAGAAAVEDAAIVRTQSEGRYPSDHFPVSAVVAWE